MRAIMEVLLVGSAHLLLSKEQGCFAAILCPCMGGTLAMDLDAVRQPVSGVIGAVECIHDVHVYT